MDSVSSESCEGDINLLTLGSHNPGLENSMFQNNDLQILMSKTSYSDKKKNIKRGMRKTESFNKIRSMKSNPNLTVEDVEDGLSEG